MAAQWASHTHRSVPHLYELLGGIDGHTFDPRKWEAEVGWCRLISEFVTILVYRVSFKTVGAIQRNPALRRKKKRS